MKKSANLFGHKIAPGLVILLVFGSCDSEKDPVPIDCSASGLQISVDDIQGAAACNVSDGSVIVSAQGGEGELTFKVNNGTFQSSGTFNNLAAGNHTITAKDENDCEVTKEVSVTIVGSSLEITSVSSSAAGCKESSGELTVTATGEGTLMYKLNTGSFQVSNVFQDLASGTYTVIVRDDSDCEISASKKVLNGTSYELEVKDIIMTNCAISGCHNGDNGTSQNWTVFSNVQNKADRIKELTQDGTMPEDGTLAEEEKNLIACWVDDGALDN